MTNPQSSAQFRRWQWNELEEAAFEDAWREPDNLVIERYPLSPDCVVLYLRGIRKHMDYESGITGMKRKVSMQMFKELLEIRRRPGSTKPPFSATTDYIRHCISELERVGLIEKLPKKRRTDAMVFRLPLAVAGSIRPDEEPQRNPKSGTTKVIPLNTGVSQDVNPKGTPKEEPHTSEYLLSNTSFTNVKEESIPRCPHDELLALWDEVMPRSVRRHRRSEYSSEHKRYQNVAKQWKRCFSLTKDSDGSRLYVDKDSGLEWWRKLFVYMSRSDFLMNRCRNFDLGWICQKEKFADLREGKFHD